MKPGRRRFLIGAAVLGGGLLLGIKLRGRAPVPNSVEGAFQPSAWLQITPTGDVIFQLPRAEMGQGVSTGLTTILAEELDYPPEGIAIEFAGVHPEFGAFPAGQVTGGSASVTSTWDDLRAAGAAARALLIEAAAQRWEIDAAEVGTENGQLIHPQSGARADYADLAEAARALLERGGGKVEYQLRDAKDYRWIGKDVQRLDSASKSTGRAQFGMDVVRPGMKIAVVVRPPQFGGRARSWDADSVVEQPGVVRVFEIHSGIAIVADTYWQAHSAAGRLMVDWDKGPLAGLDDAAIDQGLEQALADDDPKVVMDEGDIDAGFGAAAHTLEAVYDAPFLHHSTMEPQNATALIGGKRGEIWAPSQAPDVVRAVAAHYTGLRQADIAVHSTYLGGGFGRRAYVDFAAEAAAIAAQIPNTPIKLIWSREDDMRHDFYRPRTRHRLRGALNERQELIAWDHHLASASLLGRAPPEFISNMLPEWVPTRVGRAVGNTFGKVLAGGDPISAEGAHIPYAATNVRVAQTLYDPGVPVGFWRSVGHSHNAFVVEGFIDELAHAAGADPVEFRRGLLQHKPRHLGALNLAAERAAWGKRAPGFGQGVAVHESFASFVGMVIDVSVSGSAYTVRRVVAAVDCGLALNPDIVKAQVESAIVYGLSAAMKDPVSIEDGAVKQSNFHDLPVLRINESPPMDVHIVDSPEPPTGIGEPGLPPVAPALANALFAATGRRLRTLPLKLV